MHGAVTYTIEDGVALSQMLYCSQKRLCRYCVLVSALDANGQHPIELQSLTFQE